ncbi:hypothetical protein C8R43DRAFT_1128793 [Mycena crocata]|nr:hypothetical protein C8R43DRAFT_1128793 [Mycena crocata]
MAFRLFDAFAALQRIFLVRSLAFSRALNSRNLEAYWYIVWNHTLVEGMSHLLVAPQYHLWCVNDDPENDPEPGTVEGEENILAPDHQDAELENDAPVDEDWAEPAPATFSFADSELESLQGSSDESSDDSDEEGVLPGDLSGVSGITLAQSRATSQVTDFAVIEVATPPGTDTSLSSKIGGVFQRLSQRLKLTSEMATIVRSHRASLPIDIQCPRILVEIKRYIHRSLAPHDPFFKTRLDRKLHEAQKQLIRQAVILFSMPEATSRVVILVAAAGPYYTTAQIRRKKNVTSEHIAKAIQSKDMNALRRTLMTPRWTTPLYLGTEASNARLMQMRTRL